MGDLQEDAGAVAGLWVAASGATMGKAAEHFERLLDDGATLLALDVRHEPDAARVVLHLWVVETASLQSLRHDSPGTSAGSARPSERGVERWP
jgi:hypothetical protein